MSLDSRHVSLDSRLGTLDSRLSTITQTRSEQETILKIILYNINKGTAPQEITAQ